MKKGHEGEASMSSEDLNFQNQRFDSLERFERLLSEVSAKYINMPIEEIESAARKDFGRLASLLGGDSCNFHAFDQEKQDWLTLFDSSEKVFLWVRRNEFAEQLKKFRSQPDFYEKMAYMFEKWDKGEVFIYPVNDKASKKAKKLEAFVAAHGITSFVSVPLIAAGARLGAMVLAFHSGDHTWPEDIVARIRLFGEVLANALVRKRSEESLRNALSEVRRLKDQIESDYVYLSEEINLEHDFQDVVGNSTALKQLLVKVKQVAPTNASVLLLGETGAGKGVIARTIHNASGRSHRPLVQVNCAALAPTLIESELFGHEKGAFTGAAARRIGRFEIANGATLFLDEIGDLPLDLQVKLLHVLQDGEFERVGGTTTLKTDVRVIAATNKDLQEEVEKGIFRRDLWYRLNVFPLRVPPLRERTEDMPLLINHFVQKYEKKVGKRFNAVSQRTVRALGNYSWPGNIRELENFIERAVIASPGPTLHFEMPMLQFEIPVQVNPEGLNAGKRSYQEFEKKCIVEALEKTSWRVEGARGAAAMMGFKPSTFRLHMKALGIKRPGRN